MTYNRNRIVVAKIAKVESLEKVEINNGQSSGVEVGDKFVVFKIGHRVFNTKTRTSCNVEIPIAECVVTSVKPSHATLGNFKRRSAASALTKELLLNENIFVKKA